MTNLQEAISYLSMRYAFHLPLKRFLYPAMEDFRLDIIIGSEFMRLKQLKLICPALRLLAQQRVLG